MRHATHRSSRQKRGRGAALHVRDVTVEFGGMRALDGVSLAVGEREFAALIGPNGAGKTTLFNVISGYVAPLRGWIRIGGRRATRWPAHRRARSGLARTFQNVGLDRSATVDENLRTAQNVGPLLTEVRDFMGSGSQHHRRQGQELQAGIVARLGLEDRRHTPIADLSMGDAKIVEVACALVREPQLLLLDEPSSGVGHEETARLGSVLREIHRERDIAILMIEHDMSLAMGLAERIHVLNFGQLLASGTPDEIRDDPEVVAAYLGSERA